MTTETKSAGLRSQIMLAFFLMVLISGLGAAAVGWRSARDAQTKRFESDFNRFVTDLEQRLRDRVESIADLSTALSSDPFFRGLAGSTRSDDSKLGLSTKTGESVLKRANEILQSADLPALNRYPIMSIISQAGTLIYSKAHPNVFGTNLDWFEIFKKASSDGRFFGIIEARRDIPIFPKSGPSAYFVVGHVLSSGRTILGVLILGEPIDDAFLARLSEASNGHVGFRLPSKLILATEDAKDIFESAPDDESSHSIENASGEIVSVQAKTVPSLGVSLLLARSLSAELKSFLKDYLMGVGLTLVLLLAISGLLAVYVAGRILLPLDALVQNFGRLREGRYLRIETSRTDEIGTLVHAYNEVIDSIDAYRIDPVTGFFNEAHIRDCIVVEIMSGDETVPIHVLEVGALARSRALVAPEQLAKISEKFKEAMPKGAILGVRSPGEFLILLKGKTPETIDTICKNAMEMCRAISGQPFVSIGVATLTNRKTDARTILRAAHKARQMTSPENPVSHGSMAA